MKEQEYMYESFFAPHIWQRGLDIAQSGAAEIVEQTPSFVHAQVMGTDLYDVIFRFTDEEITMDCDCPYAESGKDCKHMAAVAILISEGAKPAQSCKELHEEEFNTLSEYFKNSNTEELATFFIDYLMQDESMMRAFKAKFAVELLDAQSMIRDFNQLIYYHSDQDGFISYTRTDKLFDELEDFVTDLDAMLQAGRDLETATVITAISLEFDSIPMDDSNGYTGSFYACLYDLVEELLSKEDDEINKIIYPWLEAMQNNEDAWFLAECFEELWIRQYSEEELLERRIGILEQTLAKLQKSDSGNRHQIAHYLIDLARAKETRGDSEESIHSLLLPYQREGEVAEFLIIKAKKVNKLVEEEQLILGAMEQAEKDHFYGAVSKFKEMLCRFYQRESRTSEYETVLRQLVGSSNQLEYYLEYKALFSNQEWLAERDVLIQEFAEGRREHLLPQVYLEEEMYDELLEWVSENCRLDIIRKYEKVLIEQYSAKILELYLRGLDRLAQPSGRMEHYENIVGWMQHIRQLPGGSIPIHNKVLEYRQKYKRRPNFMQALGNM